MATRRECLKTMMAVLAAPMAFLWPKTALAAPRTAAHPSRPVKMRDKQVERTGASALPTTA